MMEILGFKPRKGVDTLRIGDNEELVLADHFGGMPAGRVKPMDHGIIIICTAGAAQFEYDGQTIQLNKNDLFLYMAHSVVEKFMSSPDFDCREIWFSRGVMWNMNMFTKSSLSDLLPLKHNPKVILSDTDFAMFDSYYQQLSYHMRNSSVVLYPDIVRSIVSTFLLETLSVLRRDGEQVVTDHTQESSGIHGKKLAERFLQLVEQSDGRIRRVDEFAKMPSLYIADGHHRSAAAALVGAEKQKQNPNHKGTEEYNFFMAVCFQASQLTILDYNRVVKDLNGMSSEEFLAALQVNFIVEDKGTDIYKPQQLHEFSLYLDQHWFSLKAKEGTYDNNDPIGVLDVDISSRLILDEILNIGDLRSSQRIDFVGGLRGLGELKRRVDSGEMRAALALYPVSMQQIMDIADSGKIMPPKATWFEPKLRSGLVIHKLV